jgi:hypothetical protein
MGLQITICNNLLLLKTGAICKVKYIALRQNEGLIYVPTRRFVVAVASLSHRAKLLGAFDETLECKQSDLRQGEIDGHTFL